MTSHAAVVAHELEILAVVATETATATLDVRAQFVGATLLGVFPVVLFGSSLLYLGEYLGTGSALAGGLGLLGGYATGVALLVCVPAFRCSPAVP